MPKYKMTASEKELMGLLRLKYKAPTYAVLSQIEIPVPGEDTRTRTVDALAIGAWESRELCVFGFEFKSERSSWVSELKDPKKADDWAKFCDSWYLVAHADVVRESEVPPRWGFYEARHGNLELIRPAAKLSPKEPTRELLFGVVQAIMCQLHPEAEKVALDRRYSDGFRDGEEQAKRYFLDALADLNGVRPVKPELLELERLLSVGPHASRPERIKAVEKLVGLFTTWNSMRPTENAIRAVEFISKGGLRDVSSKMEYIRKQLQGLLSEVEDHEKIIKETALEADTIGPVEEGGELK